MSHPTLSDNKQNDTRKSAESLTDIGRPEIELPANSSADRLATNDSQTAGSAQATDSETTYSITQLSQEFDISSRTIRFYEDKGLLNPDRSKYRRAYSKRDRVRLMLILRGKRVGFSLDESLELFDIYDSGTGEETQLEHWYKLLEEQQQRLQQKKRDIEELLEEIDSAKYHCQQSLKNHRKAL